MKLFLSHPISTDTPLYGGEKAVSIEHGKCLEKGDSCNSLILKFPNHTSTHVDAPSHFIAGAKTLTSYDPGDWTFKCVHLWSKNADPSEIIVDDNHELSKMDPDTDFIIVKTGFEKFRGDEKYWKFGPGIGKKLCEEIVARFPRLKAVGMDFISISSYQNRDEGRAAHRVLLGAGIRIIEDMKLSGLDRSPEEVVALPLLIRDGDGGPVTVLATVTP